MTKDAVATMGMILDETIQGRDAVHVAVIAVKAKENLHPGWNVTRDGSTRGGDFVGIVDPFLKDVVKEGQRFWLFLYPRTITSLHHSWTHPAFEDDMASPGEDIPQSLAEQKLKSEAWLRNFVAKSDCPGYEAVIAAAVDQYSGYLDEDGDHVTGRVQNYGRDESYLHFSGTDASGEIPDEFWLHVENVTGRKITRRAKYFSCSC